MPPSSTKKKSAGKNLKRSTPTRKPVATKRKKTPKRAKRSVTTVAVKPTLPLVKPLAPKRLSLLSSLGFQVFIAGSAAVVLLALGVVSHETFGTQGSKAADDVAAGIGLEHSSPLSLSFLIARKGQAGYVNITNDSPDTIRVSVPAAWRRTEVHGAALKDVTADFPATDVVRWTLPGRAGIRMVLGAVPTNIRFDSTASSSAAVTVKSVDLSTEEIRTNVLLLKDRATTELWGEE